MWKCAHKNAHLLITRELLREREWAEQRDIEMYFCGWRQFCYTLWKCNFVHVVHVLWWSFSVSASFHRNVCNTHTQHSLFRRWISAAICWRVCVCKYPSVPLWLTPNSITQLVFGCNCHKWNRLMKRQCTIILSSCCFFLSTISLINPNTTFQIMCFCFAFSLSLRSLSFHFTLLLLLLLLAYTILDVDSRVWIVSVIRFLASIRIF